MRLGFVAVVGALCLGMLSADAEVTLPALFSDGVVLQRNAPIQVWGWAADGEEVTVAVNTALESTTAEDGKWSVTLDSMSAGGPFTMVVKGQNEVIINDVLVGEVWLCGGQSNMEWSVAASGNADITIAAANHPQIRLFKVPVRAADEPQDDVRADWQACTPDNIRRFSAVGYNFGLFLQDHLDVPIGLIQSCLGGTNVSSWVPRELMANNSTLEYYVEDWEEQINNFDAMREAYVEAVAAHRDKLREAREAGITLSPDERQGPQPPMTANDVKRPAGLYNAMIEPLQPYTIAGAIWYQGESNADTVEESLEYYDFFPMMVKHWREGWGQGDFPFILVQLAGYTSGNDEAWCLLRDAQTQSLSALPNMGMASAIDIGTAGNIHPPDKHTVGKRLADTAMAVAYGSGDAVSGPIFRSSQISENKIEIQFSRVQGGLKVKGEKPEGFEIAGADGKFVRAQARVEGNSVTVWSPEVQRPVNVRYAWKDFGPCNVYSGEDRPMVPFNTALNERTE